MRPYLPPLAGRGRIASSDAIRVRGTIRESECVESPPHPKPALRSGFDLSPQAGRGDRTRPMNAPLKKQHLIDPEICIRCNTCEETCPIDAVTHDDNN